MHFKFEMSAEKPLVTPSHTHPVETLLVFAAATRKSLERYFEQLHKYLREHPTISIVDLASALQLRDHNLEYRLALIVSSRNQVLEYLEQFTHHNLDVSKPGIYASFASTEWLEPTEAELYSAIDDHDLVRLARYWVAGADINFHRLNRIDRKSCVVLPGYAFDRDHEFSYTSCDSRTNRLATAELLGVQTLERVSVTYVYDEPFLRDHTVLGDRVLLGVTYASLVITDFFQRFPHQRALRLKRLTFVQPVTINQGEAVTVEIHTSEIPTGWNFEARYQRTPSKQLMQIAATGCLQMEPYQEESFDLERLLASCIPISALESIYSSIPAIRLGPSFKTIEKLFRTDDGVLARVCLTEQSHQESHSYALHPLAINSAFLGAAPLLSETIDSGSSNYLPLSIREIYCVRVDNIRALDRCWVHTRLVKQSRELIIFDADIVSDHSLVVARLQGCSLKRIHPSNQNAPKLASGESLDAALKVSSSPRASAVETNLATEVLRYLINLIYRTVQVSISEEEATINLMQLGLSSAELVAIAASIEQDTSLEVDPTLFFEYPSPIEVANFLASSYSSTLLQRLSEQRIKPSLTLEQTTRLRPRPSTKVSANRHSDIAIIGMHGLYAECENLDRFWQLIRDGRDVIQEVPRSHWDYRPWFDPNPGSEDKTYCKWGSFIKDVDKFDAAFFNISPREATWMDPQNRLLMQSIYAAATDAGVINQLRGSNTGVFAGICFDDYAEKITELGLPLDPYTGTGRGGISANRISFWFDFKGPSMVVNTACSSSLVALHYACQALRNNECEMAFVGGANLLLSSLHYRYFSKLGALSPTGRCHTFDVAADGYVPAECIASVLLKPLEQAEKDGDPIQAVIRGSAFAHGGYTPSLTAPSVAGEENVIVKAWEDAGINPETLTYIEAHGTGTKLGDPIEINSLNNAFAHYTTKTGFCAIGSAKANIGHAEGAAGITGLLKVILQLKYRQLPPLANLRQINPYLKLENSPVYINRELKHWESKGVRRAGISSFGFSGAFAHVVLEEYRSFAENSYQFSGPFPIILSAKNKERLQDQVANLAAFLEQNRPESLNNEKIYLTNLSYTLQVGREPMPSRLGFVVESIDELKTMLQEAWKDSDAVVGLFRGDIKSNKESLASLLADKNVSEIVQGWIDRRQYTPLVEYWTRGLKIDWDKLYSKGRPKRISLPTYAFARESYWICPLEQDCEEDLTALPQDWDTAFSGIWSYSESSSRDRAIPKLYTLVPFWNPAPLSKANPPFADRTQRTLIIGGQTKLNDLLSACFPDAFYISDITEARIGSLKNKRGENLPWQHILIIIPDDESLSTNSQVVLSAQERGILAVFRFTKALLSAGYATENLVLNFMTTQIVAIDRGEASNPIHAAVHGFASALAKELPQWKVRTLDLPRGRSLRAADLERIPGDGKGEVFAWRSGEWYRQMLIPMRHLPTSQRDEAFHPPYRNRGVYIVIGGAGGIGSTWSRIVIEHYNATVIWIGRRPLDDRIRQKIDALKPIGHPPEYIQVDASDREALATAYKTIKSRHSQIHGVIHSAVGPFDQSLSEMDEAQFRSILASKIDVSINMADVFKHELLDFMLFFSSIASFTRGGGMSGYVAGCVFEDCLASNLNHYLQFPVKVINWGYWTVGTGNTIPEATKIRMKQCGIQPIEPHQGLEVLEDLLVSPLNRIACLKAADLDRFDWIDRGEWLDVYPAMDLPRVEAAVRRIPLHAAEVETLQKQYLEPIATIEALLLKLLHGTLATLDLLDRKCSTVPPGLPKFYQAWLQQSRRWVATIGNDPAPMNLGEIWDEWNHKKIDWDNMPHIQPIVALVDTCMDNLPGILKAEKRSTDILFPNGSLSLVEGIYERNAIATHFNEVLAQTVVACLEERWHADEATPIRILEIGAGTGATTAVVLRYLEPFSSLISEYRYTDISQAFLVDAEKHFVPKYPFLCPQLFDINQPPSGQGIKADYFDMVIASNCIHATANIRRSLRNIKATLRGRGVILLNEISQPSLIAHLTFGLLEGWWLTEDSGLRVPGSPCIRADDWNRVLKQEGFEAVSFPARSAHSLGQQIIVAESDGIVRQPEPTAQFINSVSLTRPQFLHSRQPNYEGSATPVWKEKGVAYFKQLLGKVLMMDGNPIDPSEPLAVYGVDSIIIAQLTKMLNQHFDNVNAGLLFEVPTIDALVNHFVETQPVNFTKLLGLEDESELKGTKAQKSYSSKQLSGDSVVKEIAFHHPDELVKDAVAVIGMSGRFPKAKNLTEFWENLQSGRDCITDLPNSRWDISNFFEAHPETAREQGKSYCKWGAFLENFDAFDPLFFNISPREAAQMDPQARVFLQECWHAVEDAGYAPSGLDDAVRERIGVYGAVTKIGRNTSFSAMVNRVSHAMDFRGPSIPVDTMCSSALVALHLGCEALRRGDLFMAVVGAVNLYLDPRSYIYLSQAGLLAESRVVKLFSEDGTGFLPGEGVGAVVLKRLEDARRDNDSIFAVIRGSAVNHNGRANAYSTPNPVRQAEVIRQALNRSSIDPRSVGYIELAAMGSEIADTLELNALKKVFSEAFEERLPCYRMGSLKSTMGHGESVSAMAQFMKVVLQLKHRKLCPTTAVSQINPTIDFTSLPFQLQTELEPWSPLTIDGNYLPRRAGNYSNWGWWCQCPPDRRRIWGRFE